MEAEDDWVKAAMNNDEIVVHLLFCLQKASQPLKKTSHFSKPAVIPLEWTVRQLRTKKSTPPRSSPATPLEWSGATATESGGGGGGFADGFEESSRGFVSRGIEASRSKLQVRNGPSRTTTTTLLKKTRKKKTLVELKEDENLLLKERSHLKRELEALHINLEKARLNNESLKRLKMETQEIRVKTSTATSVSSILPPGSRIGDHFSVTQSIMVPITTCRRQQQLEGCNFTSAAGFLIPDLNMPFEDGFVCCEVQAGAAS